MGYHDWQRQLARTDPQLVRCWTEYTPLWDLYIEGKLQTTSWEDRQSAEKKYRTEIVANDVVLLGSRDKGNGVQPTCSDQADKPKSINLAGAGTGKMSDDDEVPF